MLMCQSLLNSVHGMTFCRKYRRALPLCHVRSCTPRTQPCAWRRVTRCSVKLLMNEVGIVSVLAPSVKMGKFEAQRVSILLLKGTELELSRAGLESMFFGYSAHAYFTRQEFSNLFLCHGSSWQSGEASRPLLRIIL